MKSLQKSEQYGSMGFNILLILLVIVICILGYMLANNNYSNSGRAIGTASPQIAQEEKAPNIRISDTASPDEFNDGLGRYDSSTEFPLDETGAGMARIDVFRRDINNDGRADRVTRTRTETGTAHFTYEYKIELNTGEDFVDITPDGFNTIEGANCALQKLQFSFTPAFKVIKISRPWQESWETPTPAIRDTYSIVQNRIHHVSSEQLGTVCDVATLF